MAKRFVFSCLCAGLFLASPVEGDIHEIGYVPRARVIDLVAPLTFKEGRPWITCPDSSHDPLRRQISCGIYGVVEGIMVEETRVIVSIGEDRFYYPAERGGTNPHGATIYLLTLSKLNRIPLVLRFQDRGGEFQIIEAML